MTPDGIHWSEPRLEIVGPSYFRTLGIPIHGGREFTDKDDASAPRVVIVDTTVAKELWSGQSPIGKALMIPTLKGEALAEEKKLRASSRREELLQLWQNPNSWERVPFEVVGEVGPIRMVGPLYAHSSIFVDYRQRPRGIPMFTASFFLRTSVEPSPLGKATREVIRAAGGGTIIDRIDTLQQRVIGAIGGRGTNKLLLVVTSITSALGLLFSALGIYGALAYATTLRTKEIGIRMALGAQRSDVFRMVVGRGLLLTAAGLLMGLASAIITTKALASYLFGVTPTDPITLTVAALTFLVVSSFACFWPARRAMRLDPMSALRYE